MATVQVTFDFEMRGYGWSEAWYVDTGFARLSQFYATSAEPMAVKRGAMLAREAALVAVTTSFTAVKQDSYLRYTNIPGNAAVSSDDAWSAVMTTFRAVNDTRRKNVWFRGQDDDAIMQGGVFQPGAATFTGPGATFCDSIVQLGWGWMHRTPSAGNAITDYVIDTDGYVHFTCAGTPFVGLTVGSYVRVSILFKGIKSRLNGEWTVQVVSNTECKSLKPMATFPFAKVGILKTFTFALTPAENYNFQKSGRRAPGRPKLHTRGHALTTPLG